MVSRPPDATRELEPTRVEALVRRLETPARLANRYELLALLGVGGMGRVFLARDAELDVLVAVKMLDVRGEDLGDRFRDEVRLARRVTHRNVARTYDMGQQGDEKFLTMEYISGESLSARLERSGPLPVPELIRVSDSIAAGLAAAHEAGVVHRDLKPDNVMIGDDGRVVIMDFGIAAPRLARDDSVAGTPRYMSPEQAAGAPAEERSDIYSLGAVMYRISTGRHPFDGSSTHRTDDPNPCDRRPQLPEAFGRIVIRCLSLDPSARYESAAEVRAALAAVPAPPEVEEPPPTRRALLAIDLPAVRCIALVQGASNDPLIADGVRMTILERLAEHPVLRVGEVQDAEAVIALEVQAAGETVSLRLRGTSASIEFWSAVIEDHRTRIANLSREAARRIVDALDLELPVAPELAPLPDEAVEAYLRACSEIRLRSPASLARAVDALEQLRSRCGAHPLLLSSLALARARQSFYSGGILDVAVRTAREAIAAAPGLPEPQFALAVSAWHMGDGALAVESLLRALELAPGLADARQTLGNMLLEAGAPSEGVRLVEDAVQRVPALSTALLDVARTHALLGRFDRAMATLARLPAGSWASQVAIASKLRFAMWRRDDPVQLRALWEHAERVPEDAPIWRYLQAWSGIVLQGRAPRVLKEALLGDDVTTMSLRWRQLLGQLAAELAAFASDWALALEELEAAVGLGLGDVLWIERCPLFNDLLGQPRFETLRDVMRTRGKQVLDAAASHSAPKHGAPSSP